jgi:hypothetical protein
LAQKVQFGNVAGPAAENFVAADQEQKAESPCLKLSGNGLSSCYSCLAGFLTYVATTHQVGAADANPGAADPMEAKPYLEVAEIQA